MLIKEYRIPLPMSLDEYQVAQLYMIQKKSREESSGEGSGVEILENRPYTDGPGGSGQYTHKIYHVGSHIPSWFRALLPKAALQVIEESWNAYPYTRTRYTCPFVEKFSIDIETYYKPDSGEQANVFNLTSAEKRQRIVDIIDIVKDLISPNEYQADEDPKLYRSGKTGRGLLTDDWIVVNRREAQADSIMCAYKLCKVEFRYWGMQSKIEQFIHDVGLRKVMLRAHRQAWCWQDEWCNLTMADIRLLEEETARMLAQKMAQFSEAEEGGDALSAGMEEAQESSGPEQAEQDVALSATSSITPTEDGLTKQWSTSSRSSHSSQLAGVVTVQSFSEWRMQNIARDSENSSEDEFFDAHEDLSDNDEVFSKEMTKWNSNDFIDGETVGESEEMPGGTRGVMRTFSREGLSSSYLETGSMESVREDCKIHVLILILHGGNILDSGGGDQSSKQADLHTLATAFDGVMRVHFPEALGHLALRLVPCPPVCADAYALVSNLSPYSHDGDSLSSSQDHIPLAALPLLATSSIQYQDAVLAVIARANQAYTDFVKSKEGTAFRGQVCLIGDCVGGILGFDALCHSGTAAPGSRGSSRRGSMSSELLSPGVYVGKDPLTEGNLEATKALSRSSVDVSGCGNKMEVEQLLPWRRSDAQPNDGESAKQLPPAFLSSGLKNEMDIRRTSSSSGTEGDSASQLEFDVSHFFLFGSPLGLVLALRKTILPTLDVSQMQPACHQIYNLFHSADPSASRLEPLLTKAFHTVPPFAVPRYQKFPLGDGNSAFLADTLQSHAYIFVSGLGLTSSAPSGASVTPPSHGHGGFWRSSGLSTSCDVTGVTASASDIAKILERWWGAKRIDYALYCPNALTAFPTVTLPHLFHASYWESTDVVAFILRQVIQHETLSIEQEEETSIYSPAIPREKWQRKRTQVKIRNVTANHRASDIIVSEGSLQTLHGRFMYGPLDVVTLTGEKVDIYVMTQPPSGKWVHFGTESTSNSGRISFSVPEERRLAIGVYPVRMIVRGDHSYTECNLTIVPPGTECVVFSIDGSFAASVSIMGSDPKVRAGAVDVVRHWQDLGYVIVYVTGRPDMQKQKVIAWLSQHNFPQGVVSFCDGLTHDPLRQKAAFLQTLIQEVGMKIQAAYGSTKDISIYTSLGLSPSQIHIVGRPTRKFQNQCQFLSEGYVAHLSQLEGKKSTHSVKTSTRSALGKGKYSCGSQADFLRKRGPLFRSLHTSVTEHSNSQSEGREGECSPSPATSLKYKSRSISLKFDGEV
ncbi:membrane-associated phosphatidylinositol transfer protein 1 [Latimeria chalumnae]|uniref:membrane-associated phosphatidylinositol transfer protein 1 n=1 Tax=Latimeria chalumnae TaxID=7897 RepID=UPI00313AC240